MAERAQSDHSLGGMFKELELIDEGMDDESG